ncbi:MAG: YqaE/Pmp3 family membrane protein [Bacteroidota bacterium]
MRTFYNKMAALSVLGLLLTACGTSNDVVSGHLISKRKVNKGFFIRHSKQPKAGQADEQEARQPFIRYSGEETELAFAESSYPVQEQQLSDAAPAVGLAENDRLSHAETQAPATPALSVKETRENKVAPYESKQAKITRAEFRQLKKEVKKADRADSDIRLLILVIICFIIPPLAVFLYEGRWNTTCWINLLLTILFFLPGLIHGLIVILKD